MDAQDTTSFLTEPFEASTFQTKDTECEDMGEDPFTIRQIASVFLSDTSESDSDECNSNAYTESILDDMYSRIQNQISILKEQNSRSDFIKSWIHGQSILLSKRIRKKTLDNLASDKNHSNSRTQETPVEPTEEEIPKVTILKTYPTLTQMEIDKEIANIDKEKLARWEKWFIQFELDKPSKQPCFKSNVRKDKKRLHNQMNIVEFYKSELTNLKEYIKSNVGKIEQIMKALETGEPSNIQFDHNETSNEDVTSGSEPATCDSDSEINSISDEDALTAEEIADYEKLLARNVIACPQLQEIREFLETTKVISPEMEEETIKLSESLKDVENELLESNNLKNFVTRIVYFFMYDPKWNSATVKIAYNDLIKRNDEEECEHNSKGCLIIYENVRLAIVMIEGSEFQVLQHFTQFKNHQLFTSIIKGKILYIHHSLLKFYFHKWVMRVENPPEGKITYLTRSKKILHRVAAARVVRMSEMLDKLYKHLSKEDRYLVDPKSLYTKSKYIILLPPPAIFYYLFKYDLLRNIKSFLNDIGKYYDLGCDDEQLFAFAEDTIYSNYVDSDDEEIAARKLNYAKEVTKVAKDQNRKIKEMNDLKDKDTGAHISWDDFLMDEINSSIIDSRIKTSENVDHPAVRLANAIEKLQSTDTDFRERKNSGEVEFKVSGKEFLTFLGRNSDIWKCKMKKYGIGGSTRNKYVERNNSDENCVETNEEFEDITLGMRMNDQRSVESSDDSFTDNESDEDSDISWSG